MTEKRFLLEQSDYDLKYEFRVADLSRVEKTKEDFWNEEEEMYNYRGIGGYLDYLYENNAFLTEKEADKILNELNDENEQLRKENQQLKKGNNDYDDAINEIADILREAYEQGVSNPYLKKISKVKVENR